MSAHAHSESVQSQWLLPTNFNGGKSRKDVASSPQCNESRDMGFTGERNGVSIQILKAALVLRLYQIRYLFAS